MKPSHRKYVKEGGGKHRGGRDNTTAKIAPNKKPKKNRKLVAAENVGSKGPGRF